LGPFVLIARQLPHRPGFDILAIRNDCTHRARKQRCALDDVSPSNAPKLYYAMAFKSEDNRLNLNWLRNGK